ncbi:Asp-tRNA(Asn)/Glu-tRNA(Gln) amidotransferase subunit GatB [Candidatus Pacearchaeota archaeon]|nr:Asp-tRNA(Asn)/Glu-tRNA(Gln) amidotransferase subunit GatB [Candidatus Pacearchaeota archaeon]
MADKVQKASLNEGMIGLEIHTYLTTKEKLFCTCKASRERGLKPNIYICPTCTGQPGAKPMLPNKSAVEKAVMIGLMLGCTINNRLVWQRKHYDWPDLPKGYQNTLSGSRAFPVGVLGKFLGINIQSMHLEEDPAAWEPTTGCIDYNRSGLPLVEIVTAPDFTTSEEVVAWLKKIIHALAYLRAVDSNAGIKVDVNVNIPGKTQRVEIKNINSLENIGEAIDYELQRQAREGGKEQETRRFDAEKGKSLVMRIKEGQDDYRFIVDPDLEELSISEEFIREIEKHLPETPEKKLDKLIRKYKIDKKNAEILAKNIEIVEFFEQVAQKIDSQFALPWINIELLRLLNYHKKNLNEVDIKSEHFAELLRLIREGIITPLKGKEILNTFYPRSVMPGVGNEGKISDEGKLENIISEVIAKNSKAAGDFKNGEKKAFDFLMGQVMAVTKKRADFNVAREILGRLLK